jgi:hypothetical protein
MLIRKAYEAIPNKGFLLVFDEFIDDDRREAVFSLLMSIHMKILTRGNNYTFK